MNYWEYRANTEELFSLVKKLRYKYINVYSNDELLYKATPSDKFVVRYFNGIPEITMRSDIYLMLSKRIREYPRSIPMIYIGNSYDVIINKDTLPDNFVNISFLIVSMQNLKTYDYNITINFIDA